MPPSPGVGRVLPIGNRSRVSDGKRPIRVCGNDFTRMGPGPAGGRKRLGLTAVAHGRPAQVRGRQSGPGDSAPGPRAFAADPKKSISVLTVSCPLGRGGRCAFVIQGPARIMVSSQATESGDARSYARKMAGAEVKGLRKTGCFALQQPPRASMRPPTVTARHRRSSEWPEEGATADAAWHRRPSLIGGAILLQQLFSRGPGLSAQTFEAFAAQFGFSTASSLICAPAPSFRLPPTAVKSV